MEYLDITSPRATEGVDGRQPDPNSAPGVSLAQARGLCEARAEEARRELGLSAEYRLAWR